MSIAKRRSPAGFLQASHLLAILVCLSVCTKMASATAWWENICYPGEVYLEGVDISSCVECRDWCSSWCGFFQGSVVKDPCQVSSSTVNCQCCCRVPSSPSIPIPPPPTPADFSPDNDLNICTSGQKYIEIFYVFPQTQLQTCAQRSLCEKTCATEGLTSVRDECIGHADFQANNFTLLEQCCCVTPSPPPPSPSPPPPPPSPPPPPPPLSNICQSPSDKYFELHSSCGDCLGNCKSICSALGSSVKSSKCTLRLSRPILSSALCQCCCTTPPPPPPPGIPT
ncbi:hypothetical protein MKW94_009483 [Papaver nudicaule]|uniref:Uncharacterized protein n=1 Tax=Papaver nudicaule TaxID=74823 RepID=A0AA41SAX5_PAPNU|nr:hypothetical protein [Papaver nudicaule]